MNPGREPRLSPGCWVTSVRAVLHAVGEVGRRQADPVGLGHRLALAQSVSASASLESPRATGWIPGTAPTRAITHMVELRFLIVAFAVSALEVACGGLANGPSQDARTSNDGQANQDANQRDSHMETSDDAAPDAGLLCMVAASDFDTSCSVAADCVVAAGSHPIQFGDFCQTCTCWCGGDAINRSSLAKYMAEVAMTPWGTGTIVPPQCSCPTFPNGPCCIAGQCSAACPWLSDASIPDGSQPD